MKVLFAVHDEKVSLSIVKKYQKEYKEIISYKNVYYFNAILKELQRDKTYDRVVIDEELEEFTSTSFEEKDKFIFNKLDNITDEASNAKGKEIPIILICSERRAKSEEILVKMFGIGIYNAIIGNDRSTDEVCRLINSPRTKKEAKVYYKIYAKDVDYDPETEDDVSEEEMQHILGYFKRLGKNEDKYVDGFRKITMQYNEKQMKVIMAILPLNVKSVLEEESPEYQRLVAAFGGKISKKSARSQQPSPTSSRLLNTEERNTDKQIVVPSSMNKNVKRVTLKKPVLPKQEIIDDPEPELESLDEIQPIVEEPKKKKRGRPPKKRVEEQVQAQNVLPGFDDEDDDFKPLNNNTIEENYDEPEEDFRPIQNVNNSQFSSLPGMDEDDEFETLPGMEEDDEFETLPGVEEENNNYKKPTYSNNENDYDDEYEDEEDDDTLPELGDLLNNSPVPDINDEEDENDLYDTPTNRTEVQKYSQEYDDYDYSNYNSLLTGDKKVIAFVGTTKNGTSFIINNIAKILSDNGINTAILDVTQNKNSYYIYNDNDDALREEAAASIRSLIEGRPAGMKVSDNLSVYVEVPGEDDSNIYKVGPILENIAKYHSVVLIDCDFNTPYKYFENSQEIFLVQNMDVLTIQPLTAFLKELKNRNILEQNKLRIIINKAVRLKGIDSRKIVGGMSNYNNPEMSIMTELFDRNRIVPIEIPFDPDVYARYLEGIADCNITVNKYPKEFQAILKKLSSIVYPLLPARSSKEKPQKKGYQYDYNNNYSNGFSNSVNNTLNNMKKKY